MNVPLPFAEIHVGTDDTSDNIVVVFDRPYQCLSIHPDAARKIAKLLTDAANLLDHKGCMH